MKAFSKIIGYESVKNELYRIIDILKNRSYYESFGAQLPNGLLIYGEPGLGKTCLAQALIKECNVKTFTLKRNKVYYDTVREINVTFDEAKKLNESIIFFDDLDKFGEADADSGCKGIYSVIQACIDSVKNKNVLVIATANDINDMPMSLLRSGRFDTKIEITIPSQADSEKIIRYYLQSKKVSPDFNYDDVSKMIAYKSCADLEKILNDGAIRAAYKKSDTISVDDVAKSYIATLSTKPDLIDDGVNLDCDLEELKGTCIHEAGHVAVAESLKPGSVGLVNIDSQTCEGNTRLCLDLTRRPERILVGLGGKASVETLFSGRCGSGCQSDLHKVSYLIREGITCSGTNGISLLKVNSVHDSLSEPSQFVIESTIRTEMDRYMFMVKDIIMKNQDFIKKVADELFEKKYLLHSDIERIREQSNFVPTVLQF